MIVDAADDTRADSSVSPELSDEFVTAVRMYPIRTGRPQWELCALARVPESTFSKLIRGHASIQPDDWRILRVGAVLGLEPERCFERADVEPVGISGDAVLAGSIP